MRMLFDFDITPKNPANALITLKKLKILSFFCVRKYHLCDTPAVSSNFNILYPSSSVTFAILKEIPGRYIFESKLFLVNFIRCWNIDINTVEAL